jgi:hypothetical protein
MLFARGMGQQGEKLDSLLARKLHASLIGMP